MSRAYVLTKSAEADLKEIIAYTKAQFGVTQCRNYIEEIERNAEAVANGRGHFKEMHTLIPNLRVALSGKHYIFCLPQHNAPAIILAILHERMDVLQRLKNRLV